MRETERKTKMKKLTFGKDFFGHFGCRQQTNDLARFWKIGDRAWRDFRLVNWGAVTKFAGVQ